MLLPTNSASGCRVGWEKKAGPATRCGLVPKLRFGNALTREAPASRAPFKGSLQNQARPLLQWREAGASLSNRVPKLELGNQRGARPSARFFLQPNRLQDADLVGRGRWPPGPSRDHPIPLPAPNASLSFCPWGRTYPEDGIPSGSASRHPPGPVSSRQGKPEPVVVVPVARVVPVAIRGAAVPGVVVPAPAPNDPVRALG